MRVCADIWSKCPKVLLSYSLPLSATIWQPPPLNIFPLYHIIFTLSSTFFAQTPLFSQNFLFFLTKKASKMRKVSPFCAMQGSFPEIFSIKKCFYDDEREGTPTRPAARARARANVNPAPEKPRQKPRKPRQLAICPKTQIKRTNQQPTGSDGSRQGEQSRRRSSRQHQQPQPPPRSARNDPPYLLTVRPDHRGHKGRQTARTDPTVAPQSHAQKPRKPTPLYNYTPRRASPEKGHKKPLRHGTKIFYVFI